MKAETRVPWLVGAALAAFVAGCGDTARAPDKKGTRPEDRYVPVAQRSARNDEEMIGSLLQDLTSDDKARSWPAEEDLKLFGTAALPKVRPLLKDARLDVRAAALRIVDAVSRDEAMPDMIDLLTDENAAMRYEAFLALKRRTMQTFGYNHLADPDARTRVQKLYRAWYENYRKETQPPPEGSGKDDRPGDAGKAGTPETPTPPGRAPKPAETGKRESPAE